MSDLCTYSDSKITLMQTTSSKKRKTRNKDRDSVGKAGFLLSAQKLGEKSRHETKQQRT
jgi:hypothetical protein